MYEPSSNTWSDIPTSGGLTPAPRFGHVCTLAGSKMYLKGGVISIGTNTTSGTTPQVENDELWSLDLTSYVWTQLTSSKLRFDIECRTCCVYRVSRAKTYFTLDGDKRALLQAAMIPNTSLIAYYGGYSQTGSPTISASIVLYDTSSDAWYSDFSCIASNPCPVVSSGGGGGTSPIGAIVGGVVAGIVVIALIIGG